MASSELAKRTAVAAIGIPIAVGVVYLGGAAVVALLALVSVAAVLEFYKLAELKGVRPLRVGGSALAAAYVVLVAVSPAGSEMEAVGLLTVVAMLLLATAVIWARGVEGSPLLSLSTTIAGALYTGGLLSFGFLLRHLPEITSATHGAALVFAPLLITWASDTFAYFVGRRWGRTKLIPRVSPGKTVQGSIGAVVGSVLAAVLYARVLSTFPTYRMALPEAVVFGLVISVAAQVGDLAESLLKRDAGVKDSGTLLPGHGGALDRFDSLLFTLPVAYFFIRLWTGP